MESNIIDSNRFTKFNKNLVKIILSYLSHSESIIIQSLNPITRGNKDKLFFRINLFLN